MPVGGGGLAAGIATFVKYLRPGTKVIGVEPEDAACMAAALAADTRVSLPSVGLFADGVAVRQAGEETFRLCREHLDEVITVDTDAMCAAVKDIFDDTRAVSEPSGALSLAGAKLYAEREGGDGTLIAISSGANLNFDRLRHIAERAEIGEQREVLLGVSIPEQPGAYRAFIRRSGRGRSPSSTTATRRAPRRRSSWASTSRAASARSRPDRRPARGRLSGARHERQRDGQGPCPLHGRRPGGGPSRMSGCSASSSRSGPAR